jgi:catechol 2,3-dioxygenase-like lactoylglutathione lyase family enzyme
MHMTIDHIMLSVSDYEKSKKFYSAALAPLSITEAMEMQGWSAYGKEGKPVFWFGKGKKPQQPMHIAFAADNRKQVDEFYQAALEVGGMDNGEPGLREHYHPNYYGAFVIDPDGHNIEAVCHNPE